MSPGCAAPTAPSPGLTRRKHGKGFTYLDADGERVTEPEDLERIAELGIPPAWKDVWICPTPAATCRRPGSTPRAASSTSTTRSGAPGATPRSSTR